VTLDMPFLDALKVILRPALPQISPGTLQACQMR
jgi:hypothetical protein